MSFTDKTIAPNIYYELFAAHGVARVMRHEKWIDAIIDAMNQIVIDCNPEAPVSGDQHDLPPAAI